MFRGVGGSIGKGTRREGVGAKGEVMRIRGTEEDLGGGGEGETRTMECGGVLGESSEGRRGAVRGAR